MRTQIKICGITRLDDAVCAVEHGADALGFIFHPGSPRYIEPAAARNIIDALPPFLPTVAVVVREPVERVRNIMAVSGCQLVQLHGGESPEYLKQLGLPAVIGITIAEAGDLAHIADYPDARAVLLDTHVSGQYGGTGQSFDWHIARQAQAYGRPVILAGGLTPENVREAVRIAQPQGVDVSSGVECSPGRKDHEKMARFFAAMASGEINC